VHRQGQGAPGLRVRRQGERRHHREASAGGQFVTHAAALPGNPYDGHTLGTVMGLVVDLLLLAITIMSMMQMKLLGGFRRAESSFCVMNVKG
jgi:hypothetical protein